MYAICYSDLPKTHSVLFFFNDTATTEIYTLSLHDALPICSSGRPCTCSSGLGQVSVSGRMRSPRPAASSMAGGCSVRESALAAGNGGMGWAVMEGNCRPLPAAIAPRAGAENPSPLKWSAYFDYPLLHGAP